MTETRINTLDYRLAIGEDVTKTFELRGYSKFGFKATVDGKEEFVSWTGMILNAVLEGLPAVEITEGKNKGQKSISIPDADTFLLVFKRLQAHREANPKPEHGQPKPTERKVDPRDKLSFRLSNAIEDVNRMQALAKEHRWGVDFTKFQEALDEVRADAEAILIESAPNAEAIAAIHKRLDSLRVEFEQFKNTEVLEARINAAQLWLNKVKDGVSGLTSGKLQASITDLIDGLKAGKIAPREADGKLRDINSALKQVGRLSRAENTEPDIRRRDTPREDNRGQRPSRPPVSGSATIGDQLSAKTPAGKRDSRR